ncbi:hypothetical protein RRG08_065146 [Elysia crispata]|uniref:Thiopurine S-methyltransferase n=1 Tax=Elysia crispata TaxID=231223 RepID=A0AAE0Z381_9GAST|nr:hypothetical protein RRG08_065146 [Elysia crispata]
MDLPYTPDDGALYWDHAYQTGRTRWHREQVHAILVNHYDKLNPDGKVRKVLVTMCGMSEDMNWLADRGLQVVGVDLSLQALTSFMSRDGWKWTECPAPKLGPDAKLFTRDDGKIKLYCGDVLNFSSDLEGNFSAIYDCSSIHNLAKSSRERMAHILKEVLTPHGRILLDAVEYDLKMLELDDLNIDAPVPPPYSITLEDMRNLFEPECSIDLVETHIETILCKRETNFKCYLIVKE